MLVREGRSNKSLLLTIQSISRTCRLDTYSNQVFILKNGQHNFISDTEYTLFTRTCTKIEKGRVCGGGGAGGVDVKP